MNVFEIKYKDEEVKIYKLKGSWVVSDGFIQFTDTATNQLALCISVDIVESVELVKVESEVI